jgi:hypothetical protein
VIAPAFVAANVILQDGQAPHFTAPMHDSGVEKPALFEIR